MRTLDKFPEKAAQYCSDKFPAKDSIVTETITTFDTIYVGNDPVFDTIVVKKNDTVYMTVVKTVPKVITKTVTNTKEVYKENTARVKSLETQVKELSESNAVLTEKNISIKADMSNWKSKYRKAKLWWWLLV
ncbi:hypothetical protein EBU94_08000, partial [bacterium]|nr:hypothetical protein [bacterium]